MKEQILGQAQRLWKAFLSFTPGQKAVTIAALAALVIGGYMFSSWTSTPSYSPLFTNLSPTDASAIIDKLNANKTPYQLSANGTEIMVPQSQVYPLRLTMSAAGLPTAGSSGYSLLDKEGITTSDFKQHVDYQRALEGELDNTIKSIDGVAAANVHLAIPTQTVFNDGTQKTTASVLLTTLPGVMLTSSQVQSVVNLVSSSVPGLTADDVSVSDSGGHVLSTAGDGISTALSDTRDAETAAYEQRLSSSAQAMLDKVLGPGHAVVTVNADLNYDKTSTSATTYSYPTSLPPIQESSSSEVYGGGASASNGPLGAGTPSASASPSASGNGAYSQGSGSKYNPINTTTIDTQNAPGNIRNLSVSVIMDQKGASTISTNDVKSQVAAAVGLDPKRGDTIAVTAASFDTSQATQAAAQAAQAAKQAAAAKQSAQMMSLLKTGGLVLLVVILVIGTLIASRRRKTTEPPDDLDIFLSTLRDNPDALPPAPSDIVPPPSRESQLNQARQRQLADMADSDPQEVARLLRSWMNAKDA